MENEREVYEWRTCVEFGCGKQFYITVPEKEFYESKQDNEGNILALPKRCIPCRKRRKLQRGS